MTHSSLSRSDTNFNAQRAAHVDDRSGRMGRRLSSEVHLLDRLSVIHKYRRAVVGVLLLVVAWFMVDSYSKVPMYRATTRIQIDEETPGVATPTDIANSFIVADPEIYLNTQQRILKGRELGLRVVTKLDFRQVPEFNGRGPKPTQMAELIARVKHGVWWPVRAVMGGSETASPPPSAPPAATPDAATFTPYAGAFLDRIDVVLVRGSRLVDVSLISADPVFAARAINTHADEYIAQNLEIKVETLAKSLAWLTAEVARQQQKVEGAERALAEYRESQDAGALADESKHRRHPAESIERRGDQLRARCGFRKKTFRSRFRAAARTATRSRRSSTSRRCRA